MSGFVSCFWANLAFCLVCISHGSIILLNKDLKHNVMDAAKRFDKQQLQTDLLQFIGNFDASNINQQGNSVIDEELQKLKTVLNREKRSTENLPTALLSYLDGTEHNNEAFVHWSGIEKSDYIFVLTRQENPGTGKVISSIVWRSTNYGSNYDIVQFPKGTIISYFYISPVNFKKAIFADSGNKTLYVTTDELDTKVAVDISFVPDRIVPHPRQEDWLLGYSFIKKELYYSKNFGKSWKLLHVKVGPRFYWAEKTIDEDDIVHLEIISADGGNSHYKRCHLDKCTDSKVDRQLGSFEPITLLVLKEFILVEKKGDDHSEMYVSYNRQPFKKAYFPPDVAPKDFIIVSADEGQIVMAVSHADGLSLYLSGDKGQFYVPTLKNVFFIQGPGWFGIDMHEVKSLKGTFLANKEVKKDKQTSEIKTYITFDKGGLWDILPAPEDEKSKCADPDDCSLHLHLDMGSRIVPGILSEERAPGFVLAHGNVGNKLSRGDVFVYVSRDGGVSWKNTGLQGYYRFNILDQGSILTAIIESSSGPTDQVNYSYDQGNTWKTFAFSRKIRVDGVLNEPEINSLVMSVYGHASSQEGWTLVTVDFKTVLPNKCEKDNDFEIWLPGDNRQKTCTLGQTLRYERRKQSSICAYGEDYEQPLNHTACQCAEEDFECDFGYEQVDGQTTCQKANWFNPDILVVECEEGQKYKKSLGYRKVASDKCINGVISKYTPTSETNCPTVKPDGLQLHTERTVVATNTAFEIELTQSGGSKISTEYTWNFGDDSTPVTLKSLNKSSSIEHMYVKSGHFNITVTATNKQGSTKTSIQMRVKEKVTLFHTDIPWATSVGKDTVFDVIVGSGFKSINDDTLFTWTWGDETNGQKPELTWSKTIRHSYNKSGIYSGSVEAINSVSSIYKPFTIHVFSNTSIVRLNFSESVNRYHLNYNLDLRVIFFSLLKREIIDALGIQDKRFVFQINKLEPFTVDVVFVPGPKNEPNTEQLAEKLTTEANKKELYVAYDTNQDAGRIISITGGVHLHDQVDTTSKTKPNLRAVYIAIPVLVAVILITVLVLVYYRRRYRESRRYTLLRSRYSEDNQLLGEDNDDDDDDPPLDLNPDFGRNTNSYDDQLDLGTGSHLVMVTGGRISDDD